MSGPDGDAELSALIRSRSFADAPDRLIRASWHRCLEDFQLDPGRKLAIAQLTPAETAVESERCGLALHLAEIHLNRLQGIMQPAGYAVSFANRDAVTLAARIPHEFDVEIGRALAQGTRWREAEMGTNGIGSCLQLRESLIVNRDEHFHTCHEMMSCCVAPVFDPFGALQGCINASMVGGSLRRIDHRLAMQLVNRHALLLEDDLVGSLDNACAWLSLRPLDRTWDWPALVAVDDAGRVIGANSAARRLGAEIADARGELLGFPLDEVLGCDLERFIRTSEEAAIELQLGRQGVPHLYACRVTWPPPPFAFRRHTAVSPSPGAPAPVPATRARPGGPRPLDLAYLCAGETRLALERPRVVRVADAGVPVLLCGETGTGKDAFARAIHEASARQGGPFVTFDCAAVPEALIERELYGDDVPHGAGRPAGKLQLASGGTLFLNEIGDMPLALQTRLLRVLSDGEIHPPGAPAPMLLDLQLIAATHRDLPAMVEEGSFRRDLYHRVCGYALSLPALRERSDRQVLLRAIMAEVGANGCSSTVETILLGYDWPGNIRELLQTVRMAAGLAGGGRIEVECLPAHLRLKAATTAEAGAGECAAPLPVNCDERQMLLEALRATRWNITATSQRLGLSRSTVYRRIRNFDLPVPSQLI
ncbi:sigma-54-dependent Fis family transcriptional regulator [Acuticoccus sediminis]|uniref:sigma-54-dependent Fis family transcriptional regulator n=1 Tax=Acuticoccus sediminis TaxID=2184697 RepID=UPI001CFF1856|nr:sigma-54-dependent Fis family transcriptional regulator [Acuticoccus sediminis]